MNLEPSELRKRARQCRATAERDAEACRRQSWITLAIEYEKLADEIEGSEAKKNKIGA